MIIERLISYIADQIKALNYVEVYGGVVRTMREKEFEDNKLGVTVYKKFPISCGVSGDVPTGRTVQRNRDLIPSDKYKSMLYWEVLQGMTDKGGFKAGRNTGVNERVRVMKGKARLVGWLNLKKLGVTNCNSAADAIYPLLPILNQTIENINNPAAFPLTNAWMKVIFDKEVVRDISIFSKYTYDPIEWSFYYPYDYFAVDVNIELYTPVGCFPDFPISGEIECNDFTVVS